MHTRERKTCVAETVIVILYDVKISVCEALRGNADCDPRSMWEWIVKRHIVPCSETALKANQPILLPKRTCFLLAFDFLP